MIACSAWSRMTGLQGETREEEEEKEEEEQLSGSNTEAHKPSSSFSAQN